MADVSDWLKAQQEVVRSQGACGELLEGDTRICILAPGHGDHATGADPVLAAITERAAKAHPGPWHWHWRDDEDAPGAISAKTDFYAIAMCPRYGKDDFPANAEFIVNARSDVDFLLARVGELEALVAAKDQVTQRLIREHNEELRIAKGEPERKQRERAISGGTSDLLKVAITPLNVQVTGGERARRYPEHDFGDEDILEDQ